MNGPRDVTSQLTGEPAHMPVPTESGVLLRAPSLPSVPTGYGDLFRPPSLPSSPTGSGDLLRLPSPQQPFQNFLFTKAEFKQLDDELLNFEMLFRNLLFFQKTPEKEIRLILQHQKPSIPPMAKSPSTPKSGTSWTLIPSPKSPNKWKPSPQPAIPKHRAAPNMIPKTLPPRPPPLKSTLSEPSLPCHNHQQQQRHHSNAALSFQLV